MSSSTEFENPDDLNTTIQNHHNNGNTNHTPSPQTARINQTITISPNDDDLTPEEQSLLAGVHSNRSTNITENDDDLVIPEEQRLEELEAKEIRPTSQKPGIRLLTILAMVGGAGAFLMVLWFGVFSPRPVKKTVTETKTTPTPTPLTDNSAELKANLAFQDQRRAIESSPAPTPSTTTTTTTTVRDRRPETTARTTITRTAAPPPPRVVTRTVQAPPRVITRTVESPPRVVTRTITRTVRVPANNPQPAPQPRITTPTNTLQPRPQVEQVDPAEQWARLSQLGEVRAENKNSQASTTNSSTTNTTEARPSPSSANISPPETQQNIGSGSNRTTSSSTAIPTVTIGNDESYTEETVEEVDNRQSSNINIPTENTESKTTVETVAYTTTDSSSNEAINNNEINQYQTQTLVDRTLVASADFLVYSGGDSGNSDSNNGTSTIALSDGEEGIINRKPRNQTGTGIRTTREIAIGRSAKGRVIVPLNWNEAGQDPSRSRTSIELTESLMATDGSIGLPKGTVLIAQPDSIASNKFVSLSAIAIVYTDSQGRTRQQQIPIGTITINSKNNEPLIARGHFDPGGNIAKQDLLVGALSGLGKVGEIINRPRSETIFDSSDLGSSQRTRTTTSEPNIIGAALEGFFGATARRLEQRSDRATEELLRRPNINVVPTGTEVTVVTNAFLKLKL